MSVFQCLKYSRNFRAYFFILFVGFFVLVPEYGGVHASSWAEDTIGILVAKLLFGIYQLFAFFVSIAAKMFLWVIDVNVFTKLLNDGAIYEVWSVVRDFCNIFFILVLLFSAFATIFQLDKYEYKKTIPLLIIMALLVNFSFPISRFVIDLANVPMYFFAQNTFGVSANDITSGVLSQSKIQNIMLPGSADAGKTGENYEIVQLLAAIICMALFGISFLVLAVLLLVRMIALAILVMFSPIGFVGMITPALHKFARDWWDRLFKWAFYGPISVLLVLVAIIVMQAAEKAHAIQPMQNLGGNQTLSDYTASIAFFAIPIVLFWIAITSAEKYSNDMSGLGIKWGSNLGRWMGRKGWHMPVSYPLRQTGITGGMKQAWNDRMAAFGFGKDAVASRERKWAMRMGGGDAARTRVGQEEKKLVDEASKKKNMVDLGIDELKNTAKSGNTYERAAALTMLAEKGFAGANDLNVIRKMFGVDSQVTRAFEAKMRTFDPVSVFTDEKGVLNEMRLKDFVASGQIDWKKISEKSLTPKLLQDAFKAKVISNKDLDELRSKGTDYTNTLKKSLDAAIESLDKEKSGKWNLSDDIQRNIQTAYLAQMGKFHASMDATPDANFFKTDSSGAVSSSSRAEAKADLLGRVDANTLKRMDKSFIDVSSAEGKQNLTILTEKLPVGKYAEIITEMQKGGSAQAAVARELNDYIKSLKGATGNATALKAVADKDHRLAHLR